MNKKTLLVTAATLTLGIIIADRSRQKRAIRAANRTIKIQQLALDALADILKGNDDPMSVLDRFETDVKFLNIISEI